MRAVRATTDAHGTVILWDVTHPWQWATLLVRASERDTESLSVRMLAAAFLACPSPLEALLQWVQETIRYEPDAPPAGFATWVNPGPFERFDDPERVLVRSAGDCDDSARLVRAIARAMGYDARFVFLGTAAAPAHVVAAIPTPRGYVWLEASLPARLGEHPSDAYRRTHP